MAAKFRPLHDRVLVQALDAETKTAGGVIIPDTAQEKPQEGKVVSTIELNETILGTPAISGNALYVRSDGHLWKFGGKAQPALETKLCLRQLLAQ